MISRYKPTGWRNEPHRHYLAAKGIKTRYNASKLSMSEFIESAKDGKKSEDKMGHCPVCHQYKAMKDKYCHDCHSLVHGGKREHEYYALKDFLKGADKEEHAPPKDKPAFLSNHKLDQEGHLLRHRDIDSVRQKAIMKLDKAMEEGNMTGQDRERFLTDDFKSTSQEYLNGHINKDQFEDEINRELDWHLKVNRRSLSPFDWAKDNENKGAQQ